MILEGVVTTIDRAGTLNVAPMGPDVSGGLDRFILRPFRTSTTFRNLVATGAGVLHITDDVGLIARAATHQLGAVDSRPAAQVAGRILRTSGRYHEFRVLEVDDSAERATIRVETVATGRQEVDLFGLNRAKGAVVEAAILATRLDFLPIEPVLAELDRLSVPVAKTGGPDEIAAFDLVRRYVQSHRDGVLAGRDAEGIRS